MSEERVPYLPALVAKAGEASAELSTEQRVARVAAWRSICALLEAVRGQLAGSPLKGMENLATSTKPWRGAQVRRKRPWDPLPAPPRAESEHDPTTWGLAVLALDADAHLVLARRNGLGDVDARPAAEGDVLAEDAEAVTETLVWALRRHLLETGNARARYRTLRRFAEKLERVLEEA
jgi:hypothetical protein